MKLRPLSLLFLLAPFLLRAQGEAPGELAYPKWTVSAAPAGDGVWNILVKGEIAAGCFVYSKDVDPMAGPIPTELRLDSVPGVQLARGFEETAKETIEHADPLWDNAIIKKFKGWVAYSANVRCTNSPPVASGYVYYQTCNESSCLMPEYVYWRIDLAANTHELGTVPFVGGLTEDSTAVRPASDRPCEAYVLSSVDLNAPVMTCGKPAVQEERKSLWGIFVLGFLGGLLALLTPCVFPMIPLTVSFFTKGSGDRAKGIRNALTYGGFILGIYLLFSLPFHILGGVDPEIFNVLSTHPVLNIFFFVIFIVFAISFFGYFEITLPASWVNKMDQNASRFGGVVGIFFMAFTLALVSFSCTGPILGSLLAGAISGADGALQLTMGMAGFGVALALPFALFALFPGWLNSLPRSGSWLTSVKVVLGFAEVALAFKFLSTADLVSHWGILPYELFLVVWVLCALGIVLYLFGLIRFPHDSPVKQRSVVRWGFIALFAATTVYLALGFRYDEHAGTFRSPKLLSGLAPPAGYSWIHPSDCPHALACYHNDLCGAMEESQRTGKPLMIDFTGHGCVNCRKMEEYVWSADGVLELIRDKYVLVSLYVDDREKLPKELQHIYTNKSGTKKQIITVGDRYATLESETFGQVSQPWYVLLSPDGRLLNPAMGTGEDQFSVPEFKAFLECGLQAMETLKAGGQ